MDKLFNTKVFEASLKKCLAEVIDERFGRMLPPVSPKEAEKQADSKLVKIEEAAQFRGYRVKYIYNLVSQCRLVKGRSFLNLHKLRSLTFCNYLKKP